MRYIMPSLLLAAGVLASAAQYRYDSYSAGRNFFTDGQEWKFRRPASNGLPERSYSVKVLGDTAVSYYMDYYGEVVRVDQPTKIILLETDDKSEKPRRFAAYEWDAEVYVYSDKAKDFVQMLNFNKKEGVKFLFNGEKWSADFADYVYPASRLLKRYRCSGVGLDKNASWIYRIGADRIYLSESKWASGEGTLEFVSYYDPLDNHTYGPEVFGSPTFEPDNACYPEGREWVFNSGYYERRGQSRPASMKVGGTKNLNHVVCREVTFSLDNTDGETALVCSHDGVMYSQGYMGMLTPRYDFRLQPGMRALRDVPQSEVKAVDRIEVNGRSLRRITFKGVDSGSEWKYWVEGFGGNSSNDMLPYEEMDDMSEIYMPGSFIECRQGEEVLFEAADFLREGSGLHSMLASGSDTPVYMTLDGKILSSPLPGCLIIRPGKKSIFKQ